MENTFLSYLLFVILGLLLIFFLNQQANKGQIYKPKIVEKMMPVILDTCPSARPGSMPVHHVGPVINFHQKFNKYSPSLEAGPPTGIPEMGWRNFYLGNFNNSQVPDDTNFNGTIVRNYLDDMDNVKNIYRECS